MIYQYRRAPAESDVRLTDAFGVGTRYPYTMGLRCLLGHDYANREVEREREERGNEVVVTYRTVETCERCGERRIVSENKEVRPVRNPGEEGVTTGLGDDGGVTPDLGGTASAAADETSEPKPEGVGADAGKTEPKPEGVGADAGKTEPKPEDVGADAGRASSEPDTADANPETDRTDDSDETVDDAIILDDDDDDPDAPTNGRGHGEWPAEDGETAAESEDGDAEAVDDTVDDGATVVSGNEGWPDPEGEDEGFDAEPSGGEATEVSFGSGLAPEGVDEAANGEAGATAAGGAVAGKQFVTAEEIEPVSEDEDEDDATEFFCPNCGFARVTGGSSMRAGDICPECYDGYIAER